MAEHFLCNKEIASLDTPSSNKFVNNLYTQPPVDLSVSNGSSNHMIGDIENSESAFAETENDKDCTGTDELYSHWLLGMDANHDENTDTLDPINYSNSLKPSSSFVDSCLDFRLDNFSPDELWSRADLDHPPIDQSYSAMMNIDYSRNFAGPIGYNIPPAHTKMPDNFYNHIPPAHDHQRGISTDYSSLFMDMYNPNLHNPCNTFMPFKNTQFTEFNTPDIFMEDERNEALMATNNLCAYNKEEATYHILQPKSAQTKSVEDYVSLFGKDYFNPTQDLAEFQVRNEYFQEMATDGTISLNLDQIIADSDRKLASINSRSTSELAPPHGQSQQMDNFALNMNIVKEILAGRGRSIAPLPVRRPVGRPPNRQREAHILASIEPSSKPAQVPAIVGQKPAQKIPILSRYNGMGLGINRMTQDGSSRSRELSMEAYMRKITESVARNNAIMHLEPIVIDPRNKPSNMPEAICKYIDYLFEENEKRTRISSCSNTRVKTDFLKEDYYRQVFCNPVPFPTKKFQDWLKLFNVYVEITDLEGQTLPQTIFQTSDSKGVAEMIGDPLNLERSKSPEPEVETKTNWNAMRTFPASLRTRGRPKGSYSNFVAIPRSSHSTQAISQNADDQNTCVMNESVDMDKKLTTTIAESKSEAQLRNSMPKKGLNLKEVKLFVPRSSVGRGGGIRIFRPMASLAKNRIIQVKANDKNNIEEASIEKEHVKMKNVDVLEKDENLPVCLIIMLEKDTQTDEFATVDNADCTLCEMNDAEQLFDCEEKNCKVDIFRLTKGIQVDVKQHKHLEIGITGRKHIPNLYITKKKKVPTATLR